MGRIVGRPFVLVPVGVVLIVAGLFVALNGIGAHRWGVVLDERRWCGTGGEELCLDRVEATLDGPRSTRREAGDEWVVRPTTGGAAHEIDLPSDASDELADGRPGTVLALAQPDGDVVGIQASGRVVGTTWVGTPGVLQLVGLGLVVLGLGLGMVVAGSRIRRSTGSWSGSASVREHGSGWVAVPVVGGALLWLLPRFL
jgi:hypothetical protein